LVTIGSGVSEGAGVEFPTFPLTCVVVLKTLWHYRASVWYKIVFLAELKILMSITVVFIYHSLHGIAELLFKGRSKKYRKWHFSGCCRRETP